MNEPILRLVNIESSYGPVRAIRGVSLEVARGAIVTVLGTNGAGKSTILKTISGILDPDKGQVFFEGQLINGKPANWIVRQGISHVPEGREIFPLLTVHEHLLMGAYTRMDADVVKRDIERMYAYFPILKARRDQEAQQLSGGEQQMLAIARALMARPKLLLLDEPSLGLSPKLVKEIFEIIVRINAEEGTTMLLVEQNAAIALACAQFGYVLEVGRIVLEDTSERLLQKEDVREFFLGMKSDAVRGERRWKRKKQWR
ncbi:ABC transporter ATP-binding protein [Roseateles sp.]|uniref:ABC transporter ATP-binding protein n=1 Tax=Roseateles sp. TaxID=1971397 RepID=UPI00286C76F0|nr:ABC transporter ATP-binding protein [Roseateles sp.]